MSEPSPITPLTREMYHHLLEQIKDAEDNLNMARQMIGRAENKLFTMKSTILQLDPEYRKIQEERKMGE